MKILRAVILAIPASGDLPWSSASGAPKLLVPVATQPILFHTLDALRCAGITESVIVSRPCAVLGLRDAVGGGERWGMVIDCQASIAKFEVRAALEAAGDLLDDECLLVHRADAMLRAPLSEHVRTFAEDGLDALALRVGPTSADHPGAIAGYLLSARAVSFASERPAEADPLPGLRLRRARARVIDVAGCLACDGDERALLRANCEVLSDLRPAATDALIEDCEIQGNVVVHPTAIVRNTLVRGPVIISAGAEIVDSYIGPYTSIGCDTRVHGTEIEHSIVMDGAHLMFVGTRLETSVIGRDASIVRRFDLPNATRMVIGEGAEVALS